MTSNGYDPYNYDPDSYENTHLEADHNHEDNPTMYCIKTAYARRDKAVILACERDGCCHLISVGTSG